MDGIKTDLCCSVCGGVQVLQPDRVQAGPRLWSGDWCRRGHKVVVNQGEKKTLKGKTIACFPFKLYR